MHLVSVLVARAFHSSGTNLMAALEPSAVLHKRRPGAAGGSVPPVWSWHLHVHALWPALALLKPLNWSPLRPPSPRLVCYLALEDTS